MCSKVDLIAEILSELKVAQVTTWEPPTPGLVKHLELPPSLPLNNGRQLRATEALLQNVSKYADICLENDFSLQSRISNREFGQFTKQAFGKELAEVGITEINDAICRKVSDKVDATINRWIHQLGRSFELALGCHLFKGSNAYPCRVGPVLFEVRDQWALRLLSQNKLSTITTRRLQATWKGKSPKKRKPSFDSLAENAALETVGNCPIVCSVEIIGLSGKYAQYKGVLAGRLAMTAIALMWERPSEGLGWMNLLYDRRIRHRHTATFYDSGRVGMNSEVTQMPCGRWTNDELIADLQSFQWFLDAAGEAIRSYVQPSLPTARPKLMNALFLSILWLHEGCREPLDQIATTKFAASMDALASGGRSKGIIRLLETRLGFERDKAMMRDGTPTKTVIKQIYDAGRSRMIHGSSSDYTHDWSDLRRTAETIARLCLVECAHWMSQNPDLDDVQALSSS